MDALKPISLDLSFDTVHETISLKDFFVIHPLHILTPASKRLIEDFSPKPEYDFSIDKSVQIEEFYDYFAIDIAHPDLTQANIWKDHYFDTVEHNKTLNINPPLSYIPRTSIDIRSLKPLPSPRKYSDLFQRELSLREKTEQVAKNTKQFFIKHQKKLFYSIVSILLLIVPLYFIIQMFINNAISTAKTLAASRSTLELQSRTQSMKNDIDRARFLFLPFSWIPNSRIQDARNALQGFSKLTNSLNTLTHILPSSSTAFGATVQENSGGSLFRGNSKDIFLGQNIGIMAPTELIEAKQAAIAGVIDSIMSAQENLSNIKATQGAFAKVGEIRSILQEITPILTGLKNNQNTLLEMLGSREPQRYIIFNQNRDEIRANGGFPGSIISFTMYKGNILDYRTDDVYYYDWNLYPHKELPPPGLALLSNNYGLRDVNYYPDFLDTIEKANSFIEKSGESTITTGIAIHQGLIEDMLAITGPVKLEGVETPFDSNNFSILMSVLVENKFAKEKTPKDILIKFIGAFSKHIAASGKSPEVLAKVIDYWNQGEIQMASRNDQFQRFIKSITPPLPWEDMTVKNWIYPVFTSVSGNKSDRYLSRRIESKVESIGNCNYKTSVELQLTHQYAQKDLLSIQSLMNTYGITDENERKKMEFIQGNGKNISFVRLYLPRSTTLAKPDKTITTEDTLNSTIMSFTLETNTGSTSTKKIELSKHIDGCETYDNSIKVYRQPGLRDLSIGTYE